MSNAVIPVQGEAVKMMPTFSRRSFISGCTAAAVCAAFPAFAAYEVKPVVTNDYNGVRVIVNYDKSRIAPYTLEEPLTFVDGRKVATRADWRTRREELLGVFAKEMYGVEPPRPEALITDLVDEKITAAGYAVRRQYKMYFKADRTGPCIGWIVWVPRWAKKPVPVVAFLNYRGNHELVFDTDIPVQTAWSRAGSKTDGNRSSERTRGVMQDANSDSVFPLSTILARGYAAMSACYCEVSPDPSFNEKPPYEQKTFSYTGVFDLWGKRDESRTDNITALGAWAWALSRGLDLAGRIPEIDAKKSVVTGCSRPRATSVSRSVSPISAAAEAPASPSAITARTSALKSAPSPIGIAAPMTSTRPIRRSCSPSTSICCSPAWRRVRS